MPSFVKMFLDDERDNNWSELRDILPSLLELLDGQVDPPKLYAGSTAEIGAAGGAGNRNPPVANAHLRSSAPSFWTHAEPPRVFAQQLFAISVVMVIVAVVAIVSWFIGK
jgi:hypothetical protein